MTVVTPAWLDALPATLKANGAIARARSAALARTRLAKLASLNQWLAAVGVAL